jgi:hypothetical protein
LFPKPDFSRTDFSDGFCVESRLDVTKGTRLGAALIRIRTGFPPLRLQPGLILRNNAEVA